MNPSSYSDFLKPAFIPKQKYQMLRRNIKSGDILLCSGSDIISRMIQKETNSRWSHVGIIRYDEMIDRMMVYESVEDIGVRYVPLSCYLTENSGELLIARHAELRPEDVGVIFSKACAFIGQQYDKNELLKILYRLRFPYEDREINLSDGFISSEYAYMCFRAAGIEIQHRGSFITPNDFFVDPYVKAISYIEV